MERRERLVAIDAREAAILVDRLAVAHHEADTGGLAALDHGVEKRRLGVEVGVGNPVPVDQSEVCGPAGFERAEPFAIWGRPGSPDGRHAQHLPHAGDLVVAHAGHAVGAQHHPHLL